MQTNNCIARAVQSVSHAVIIPLRVGEQRKVDATLHEGTSMAALSPDGRTIAIDLLGRTWTLLPREAPGRALPTPSSPVS